jgi:hypothetical protein
LRASFLFLVLALEFYYLASESFWDFFFLLFDFDREFFPLDTYSSLFEGIYELFEIGFSKFNGLDYYSIG